MESPIKYFSVMDDFNQLGKVKHKLANIIAITIAAVICGCENWYEIEDYGKQKQAEHSAQNFSLINKVALNMIRHYKPDEDSGSKKISMIRKRKMANRDNEYLLDVLLSFNTEKIKSFRASALMGRPTSANHRGL